MRLIMVRHGEPNYQNDCLTETGRGQAAACAGRLQRENISEIYASSMGRAKETASFTAAALGLPVTELDWMREISWGGEGLPYGGHPWELSDRMITEENFDFFRQDWRKHPYWKNNEATRYFDRVAERIDGFLEAQGYVHEGRRYLCRGGNDRNIALFSHGGSGGAAIAHMLALPFPYVLTVMPYYFTSVIILEFPDVPGEYVRPRLELFNDVSHLSGETGAVKIQKEKDKSNEK